jgi:hypothetical protein
MVEDLGMHNMVARVRASLGLALLHRGALDEARALEQQGIEVLGAQGSSDAQGEAHAYLSAILLLQGDRKGAEREARAARLNAPGARPDFLEDIPEEARALLLAQGWARR